MYIDEQRRRNDCGHYPWEESEIEGFEPGYRVCHVCAEMEPYKEKIRQQNRERNEDIYGLTFRWFPPREESNGD